MNWVSLRIRLVWAFVLVVFAALALSFVGLNLGLYSNMMRHMGGTMMDHGEMMSNRAVLGTTLRFSLVSTAAALGLAVLAALFVAERITRPLRHLSLVAHSLDLRDLSRRVPEEGNDEIAELARAFNRMGDRLEAEERSRRQVIADVAHELRHPLAVMKGRLDLVQDGKVELAPEELLPLQDEVIRMTRLVSDLRDLSLAEVGGLSLHLERMVLGGLLRRLAENLEPVAEDRGVTLTLELSDPLPAVSGDPDRLRQVFVNLLANGVQYTGQGGRVTLRATAGKGEVSVEVADTGVGIAPEDLPHVFDRFYRSDKSRSRGSGGSGLGLAIVRSLVELHGGRVGVKSRPGEGSVFTVTLPQAE